MGLCSSDGLVELWMIETLDDSSARNQEDTQLFQGASRAPLKEFGG